MRALLWWTCRKCILHSQCGDMSIASLAGCSATSDEDALITSVMEGVCDDKLHLHIDVVRGCSSYQEGQCEAVLYKLGEWLHVHDQLQEANSGRMFPQGLPHYFHVPLSLSFFLLFKFQSGSSTACALWYSWWWSFRKMYILNRQVYGSPSMLLFANGMPLSLWTREKTSGLLIWCQWSLKQ